MYKFCWTLKGVKKEIDRLGVVNFVGIDDENVVTYTLNDQVMCLKSDWVEDFNMWDFIQEIPVNEIKVRKNFIGYTIGPDTKNTRIITYMTNEEYAIYVNSEEDRYKMSKEKKYAKNKKSVKGLLELYSKGKPEKVLVPNIKKIMPEVDVTPSDMNPSAGD